MKSISIPTALTLGATEDGKTTEYSFRDFVTYLLNTNPAFNETGAGLRASVRIDTAVSAAVSTFNLSEEDWVLLKDAAELPKVRDKDGQVIMSYPLTPSRALVPFLEAIASAK